MRYSLRDPAWLAAVTRRAWSPLALAPDLWLDASDASTITDAGGGAVSQWRDKSGFGRHMSQATALRRPTTGTRTQNGLNVIDFVRVLEQWLDGGDILDVGTGSLTIATVFKLDDSLDSAVVGKSSNLTTAGNWGIVRAPVLASPSLLMGIGTGLSGVGRITIAGYTSTAARTMIQRVTRAGGASSNILSVGASAAFATVNYTDTGANHNTAVPFRIGEYGGSGLFLDGLVAEVIIWLRAISGGERDLVSSYLSTKWGTA